MSCRLAPARSTAAGSILPLSPGSSRTLVPLEKNSGAPHSSVSTWAVSWQRMLWWVWHGRGGAAVGEDLARAALVGLDVGRLVAEDAVVALAQVGQGEGVGSRAVEDEE